MATQTQRWKAKLMRANYMNNRISLKEGEKLQRDPNMPALFVQGKGDSAYIWIGNDAVGDMACFATLSGRKSLEKLANTILEAISKK